MMIQLVRQAAAEVQASWLVLPLFEDLEATPVVTRDTALAGLLARLVERKEVTGSLGELTALHGIPGFAAESLLLVGLGLRAKFDAGSAFAAGFALAKRLSGKARDHVAVLIPEGVDLNPPEYLSALVEGVVAGTRGPGLRKSEPSRHEFGVLSFVVGPGGTEDRLREIQDQLRRGEIVGQAINLARDLVNTPPSDKAPAHLAERIRGVAVEAGINVEVWDEARIREAEIRRPSGRGGRLRESPFVRCLAVRSGRRGIAHRPGGEGGHFRLRRAESQAERVDGRHEDAI